MPVVAREPPRPASAMQNMMERMRRHSLDAHMPVGETCLGGGASILSVRTDLWRTGGSC